MKYKEKLLYYTLYIPTIFMLCIFPQYVKSFSLDDHRQLSRIAIHEFFKCVEPRMLNTSNEQTLERFTNIIMAGNTQEDIEYFDKMLQYSHFYNPHFYVNAKWLNIIDRCPSNYRINHIEQILDAYMNGNEIRMSDLSWDHQCQPNMMLWMDETQALVQTSYINFNTPHLINSDLLLLDHCKIRPSEIYQEYFNWLGRAIHHLQDMSSPTHVVPILHPFAFDSPTGWEIIPQDGFEHNEHRISVLNNIIRESHQQPLDQLCTFKRSTPQTLFNILDQGARRTLNSLTQEVPVYVMDLGDDNIRLLNDSPTSSMQTRRLRLMKVTWEKWYDTHSAIHNPDHFGQYGFYKDAFGLTKFRLDSDDPSTPENEEGWIVRVDVNSYTHFIYQRYRQAIEDTKKALHYAFLKIKTCH